MPTWEELTTNMAGRLVEKFGRAFVWTPQTTGLPVTIKGILDHNYLEETGGVGIQTFSAQLTVDTTDVPGIDTGDQIKDGAINYIISELHGDDEGMTDIILMRV
jgi:hypothetical protein